MKQFLGLVGYYHKFIPRFSDIARPLNALTRKGHEFIWDIVCEQSFQMLKQMLTQEPILVYPDPSKLYVLFMDASKYAWSCVLTQEYIYEIDGKEKKVLYPITYMSGLFKGSQINRACLTKEAYAIFMSVKKLAFYLEDADITLQSDHLPFNRFLAKNTLNLKVNNWAVEISPFRITFEYIKGIKNTLADMMSRLIEIDPQIELISEKDGFEFGYYAFDVLPPIEVQEINDEEKETSRGMQNLLLNVNKIENLIQLQLDDPLCKNITKQLNKGNIIERQPYFIENYILHGVIKKQDHQYQTVVVPKALIPQILHAAHNLLGHNGIGRTYAIIKQLYYWKGMKASVTKHIRNWYKCQQRNKQVIRCHKLHFDTALFSMDFISMDLIGEVHPPLKKGHKYALTVICMLTGYVFYVPLKTNMANEVIQAYIDNVYAKFGRS